MKTLRLARKMKKITQAELAEMLSRKMGSTISQQQICNYETDFSIPPLDKLIALEEILNISLFQDYRALLKRGLRRDMRNRFKNGRRAVRPS